ncbi:MAG: glycosyltransferase family 2 protein [Candidatus Desulfacyla sp.]
MLDISTIIVSYNTAELLTACLKSVASRSDLSMEVIVVDNASQDDSAARVSRDFPWVKLIANEQNAGFARANNQALNVSSGEYVYFLNPDAVVQPGAFEAMMRFMSSHTDVGLAGTRILNPDGSVQPSVERRYPGERRAQKDLRGLAGDIAWVLGASMIARRAMVEDLGGFDEGFFLYGEEQDLCLRIRKKGWKIGFIPDAAVVHWGGQSERNTSAADLWKKKFAAELLFYRKHYSRGSVLRIHRANVVQALWRIFSLRLTLPLCLDKEVSLDKLNKYRLALKTFHFWKVS